jgi:dTDP-4-amino-4,6-dideoxygalactose transaminase
MIPFFNLRAINATKRTEILEAITRVVDRGWYILGEEVTTFEAKFAEYCGAKHVVGVANGLDALTLIIRAYKEMGVFHDGDEIIVAANSYIATVLSITENNLVPVLVEPDPATYNLDSTKIEAAITGKTKAIMALHLYGLINYDTEMEALKTKYNLKIIEDGAQAAGATWNGKRVGVLGDACGMSLYPTKNLGAIGDAGVVITNDDALADTVRTLANYGSHVKYYNEYKGTNSRLDEVQAAVLQVKLTSLDHENDARRALAEQYVAGIKNEKLILPSIAHGKAHVWHLFILRTQERAAFIEHMKAHGVDTLIHYPVPPHKQKAYTEFNDRTYLITEALAEEVVSIPLYPLLTEEERKQIIDACNAF